MKKIKTYKKFSIYEARNEKENDGYQFALFCPEESPSTYDSAEWQSDSIQELIDFVNCY